MTATLMSIGRSRGSMGASDARRRDDASRDEPAGERGVVPPSRPERPKNWLGRLIDVMRTPVEPNCDNP